MEEDVTPGLLQRSAGRNQEGPGSGSAPANELDSKSEGFENGEVLVGEGKELGEVDESGGCCGAAQVWHCELNLSSATGAEQMAYKRKLWARL